MIASAQRRLALSAVAPVSDWCAGQRQTNPCDIPDSSVGQDAAPGPLCGKVSALIVVMSHGAEPASRRVTVTNPGPHTPPS
jgi:hypothetical protein